MILHRIKHHVYKSGFCPLDVCILFIDLILFLPQKGLSALQNHLSHRLHYYRFIHP